VGQHRPTIRFCLEKLNKPKPQENPTAQASRLFFLKACPIKRLEQPKYLPINIDKFKQRRIF
jgi:hypothetical protein